jgi:myo-inositol-1(or 4)-monophosphatase
MDAKTDLFSVAQFARKIAEHAGKKLRASFRCIDDCPVVTKRRRNIQTNADIISNEILTNYIKNNYPSHFIKSEETPGMGAFDWTSSSDYVWIIDPCDGTKNFLSGIPFFSIAISLVFRHEVVLGVVYDPIGQEMFSAISGQGATLNGRSIHVGRKRSLRYATVGIDIGYRADQISRELAIINKLARNVSVIRSFYSGALELSYVAANRISIHIDDSYKPWDVTAGALIAQEAGATITDLEGNPWTIDSRSIVAASPGIHSRLMFTLNK